MAGEKFAGVASSVWRWITRAPGNTHRASLPVNIKEGIETKSLLSSVVDAVAQKGHRPSRVYSLDKARENFCGSRGEAGRLQSVLYSSL